MDYLQYKVHRYYIQFVKEQGFKPYYKWITFNTEYPLYFSNALIRFKPYYKWITFNTK